MLMSLTGTKRTVDGGKAAPRVQVYGTVELAGSQCMGMGLLASIEVEESAEGVLPEPVLPSSRQRKPGVMRRRYIRPARVQVVRQRLRVRPTGLRAGAWRSHAIFRWPSRQAWSSANSGRDGRTAVLVRMYAAQTGVGTVGSA